MLEIKDIDKVKITNVDMDNIQLEYKDNYISLDRFKDVCTVVTIQKMFKENEYKIVESNINNFIEKLINLDTVRCYDFKLYKNSITREDVCNFLLNLQLYGIIKCDAVFKEKLQLEILKVKSEIVDIERKILNLTRKKELKKVALHGLEATLEEKF